MSANHEKFICIYHGNCADGFGAAWVVWRRFQGLIQIEFHAGVYGKQPPDIKDKHVIMVDFSYKRDVLLRMAEEAKSILILDHHKSSQEDLHGISSSVIDGGCLIECHFDMNRSGAMMAWDYYYPGQEPPALLKHIQDRDLWLFRLDGTREIQANLFSYPYNFDIWDQLMQTDVKLLVNDGIAIERKHHKDVAELVAAYRREMCIGGHWVPVANLPYTLTSDAGALMCKPYASPNLQGEIVVPPFAACYWDTPDGRTFSLRSATDGMDVAKIAEGYGGGGHKNASGFRVGFDHDLCR